MFTKFTRSEASSVVPQNDAEAIRKVLLEEEVAPEDLSTDARQRIGKILVDTPSDFC